jgi:hypothetical protein
MKRRGNRLGLRKKDIDPNSIPRQYFAGIVILLIISWFTIGYIIQHPVNKNKTFKRRNIKKYERQIEFYPVDEKLYNLAKIQHDNNGGGGCSHYIFSWLPTREEYIHYQI